MRFPSDHRGQAGRRCRCHLPIYRALRNTFLRCDSVSWAGTNHGTARGRERRGGGAEASLAGDYKKEASSLSIMVHNDSSIGLAQLILDVVFVVKSLDLWMTN
ncbi:uncharacterized protein LOC103700869 [Phoenix dactylifera]|uniref:Uncharacterized protein LOC103700869 n=1 Tax=Phoenix dactylifera TaxID=42345 RepID=A0A8B8J1K0_PHODC|nr:uncharacterized protein LOC103700869 [Phoenix dactylifera]